MSENTWPRDQYTGPGGGVFIQVPAAGCIQVLEVALILALAVGCTQGLEVGCTPGPAVGCTQALEAGCTQDLAVDCTQALKAGCTQDPEVVFTAAQVAVCTLDLPNSHIVATYLHGQYSSSILNKTAGKNLPNVLYRIWDNS